MTTTHLIATQAAAQVLLDTAEEQLCDFPAAMTALGQAVDDETAYYRTMHRALLPYRAATRMHTHFAFLAKTRCVPAAYADGERTQLTAPLSEQAKYMDGFFRRGEHPPSRPHDFPLHEAGVAQVHDLAWNRLEQPWSGRHGPAYLMMADTAVPHPEDDWCPPLATSCNATSHHAMPPHAVQRHSAPCNATQ